MSYSCADFVDDCEANADTYDVPKITADALEDCDPELHEDDALRLLAERVARAFAQRRDLLREVNETLRDLKEWDGTPDAMQIIIENLAAAVLRTLP